MSIGENIAYFPAISCSKNESVAFNFGSSPLVYDYGDSFETLDIPEAIFNGSLHVTVEFVELLRSSVLKILALEDVSPTNK